MVLRSGLAGVAHPMGTSRPSRPMGTSCPSHSQCGCCLCQHPASVAGGFPSHHPLQFPFRISGWKCPTRYLPPCWTVFWKISEKKRNIGTIVFLKTKLRKNTLFCQRFKTPHSCLSEQDRTVGQRGVVRYEVLVTTPRGHGWALLLGRSPSSRVRSGCSQHLSAGLWRWLLQGHGSFPSQLPLLLQPASLQPARCSTGCRHTRHRFMAPLPLGQAESSFQLQKLKRSRVGKA